MMAQFKDISKAKHITQSHIRQYFIIREDWRGKWWWECRNLFWAFYQRSSPGFVISS